jgi:O-antigen/teichoic acid export membrane protein
VTVPQSILTNTTIASAGRVVNIVLGIVITAAITRYLGAARYGSYILLLSYGTILQVVADFGLYLTLTRDIAQRPQQQQHIYSLIASLRLTLLVVVFLIGTLIVLSLPPYRSLTLAFLLVAVGLMFQSLSQLLMGVYQKHGVVWRATVGDLAGRAVQLAGVFLFPFIALADYRLPVTSYELIYMVAVFTGGAAVAYTVHSLTVPAVRAWRLNFSQAKWRNVLRLSWPLGAMLILNVIYFRIDIVMLSYFKPGAEVGWYGLAYRVIESALFFPAMFGGLLLPNISALIIKNRQRAQKLLEQALYVTLLAAVLAGIVFIIFAQPVIVFLSGQQFRAAAPLLQVLTGALFAMFFGNIFGFVLVALKKHKQLLVLYGTLALGNVLANLIFIPLFGVMAAAWTTVVTEVVAAGVAGVLVWWAVPYRLVLSKAMLIILAATLAAAVAVILPQAWHILLKIALVVGLYIVSGAFLGVIRRSHLKLLLTTD